MSDDTLPSSFSLAIDNPEQVLDDPQLLDLFAQRVEEMITHQMDLLLSTLYRLDVEETKIRAALDFPYDTPARSLARLILERQKERIETKKKYPNKSSFDADEAF